VTSAEEFRKLAEEAREMAAQAENDADRDFWILLAEDWISLAEEAEKRDLGGPPVDK
jgi:hypothetical protein